MATGLCEPIFLKPVVANVILPRMAKVAIRLLLGIVVAGAASPADVARAGAERDSLSVLREFMQRGDFPAAEAKAAQLLASIHPADRADSLRLLDVTAILAEARIRLGRFDDPALPQLVASSLALSSTLLGPADLTTARAHQFAGYLARARGQDQEERAQFGAALAITENSAYARPEDLGVALGNLAKTCQRQDDLDEAEALLDRALRVLEASLPSDHVQIGSTLLNWIVVRLGTGDTTGVAAGFERVVDIYERRDPDGPRLADALYRQGSWLLDLGNAKGADLVLERAGTILEFRGGNDATIAACRLARARAQLTRREYDAAAESARRARDIYASSRGGGSNMADCLVALGDAQRGAGQHEEASESYAAALDILDRSAVPDPVRLADCLQALTSHCLELARYSEALRHARRALGVQLRLRDPGDPALVKARLGFAAALRSDGKPDSAEAQCRTVLAEIKAAGTGDESLIAEALLQSAALARERGDQPAARAQAQEAVSLLENRADPDDPRWPTALHELGIALRRLGNERAARDTLQLAFRLASREGRRTPAVAAILSSMATLDRARGDTAAAAAAFAEALTILDDTLPDGHPQQALVLRNLASLRNAGGRFLEAEQLYRRALGMLRAALGDDHPDVAAAHLGLGNALKALGRLADARQEYERAADIHLRAFGPDAPPLALDYHNLAALLLETDEPDRAMDLAGEAERIGEQHFRLIAQGVSEREALHYSAGRVSGTDIILTAAVRSESPVAWEQAWDLVVRSRAVVLEEIAQRRRFLALADEDPKVFGLSTRLEEASNELAHLVVQGRGVRTQEEYLRQLAETRSTKEQAERNLAAVSREFRAKQTLQEVGLAEVLDALPPGAGMVAWVRFNLLEREVREGREPPPEEGLPSYAAFVADGASRRIRLVHLGPAAQIDSLVAAWHEQAGSGLRAKGRAEAEEDYGEAGGALRRAVWDSAAVQVGNVERLFLVPDGSLNLVSFEVLPDEAGGFLLEHAPLFCVLSSERDMAAADRAAALGTGLLTAADPDYERMPSAEIEASGLRSAARGVACGKFKSLWFAPIPGTAAEQREVVQLWGELTAKGLSGAGRSGRDVHRLTGPEATELRFRRLALGREIIHVATHGFYLGAECGGDRASGGSAAWDELTVSGLVGESPLLLSGLAFAGANLREDAPAPADDGILTAEEITSLDLTGVDTVVLSACETGLGKVEAGEGVFGLRRAFQVAGVRSLVMTLWSIDDQATVAWMRAMFQHRLLENLPPARAARAASLDILRERRLRGETDHPFHWGAFLVTGGWK